MSSVGISVSVVVDKHEGVGRSRVSIRRASAGSKDDSRVNHTVGSGEGSEVSKEGSSSDYSSGGADVERT